ncbi:unnamed protein product [Ostreobium quekettii]|uniref:Uncharacterized protein n=1 Tax=Ostreobium quekettii TaxID=121088 RepID=A0A8S1J731_9CHLO|nr:unnamed protein product [Ostreobium quekettii]
MLEGSSTLADFSENMMCDSSQSADYSSNDSEPSDSLLRLGASQMLPEMAQGAIQEGTVSLQGADPRQASWHQDDRGEVLAIRHAMRSHALVNAGNNVWTPLFTANQQGDALEGSESSFQTF